MEIQISKHRNTSIRVLIVDDHVILRQGISVMLREEDDFEVVGEAENEMAALWLTKELKPDIVLLDISLGTANGLDPAKQLGTANGLNIAKQLGTVNGLNIAKQLLRSCPDIPIVLFGGSNDEKLLLDALQIGVHGYLQKTLSIDDLRRALRAVHRGERVLGESRAITQVVVEFHRLTKEQNRLRRGLSMTEIELVRLVSNGCTNKQIGNQLFWSEVQVKRKMQDIYRKLQVTDRAQAVAEAMRQGLI